MAPMITPAILTLLLRPYGFAITERCLTDWRRKGDLPQLSRQSRGYRAGVLRYWAETNILKQALEICRRLRGKVRKRVRGVIFRNWLGGAPIPTSRAQADWVRCLDSHARMSKTMMQKLTTEMKSTVALTPGAVRDTLDEIFCILLRPQYAIGVRIDIYFIEDLIQRIFNKFAEPHVAPIVEEEALIRFLTWVNAMFSPAGFRNAIASATPAELCRARDRYIAWWAKIPSLMPLGHALAPLIVPLLLPMNKLDDRLAGLLAV